MVRAVFDPNVLVSAVLSRSGAAAQLVAAWNQGRFELVVTPMLLDELTRVFTYTKIASRVAEADAAAYIALLRARAHHVGDPDSPPPMACSDPNDDYLIAAAHASASMLVT
ncbi:MAG TPA: putative toxin-antitoxin system toxin component, PIN family, partial [Steroidobacteraceae bacterium]